MNNFSLELHLLHTKPTAVAAAPKYGRASLVRKSKVAKAVLDSKPKSSLVLPYKGVDPLVESKILQIIERQFKGFVSRKETRFDPIVLREAYETCRQICAERSTTYYLGSLLMTEERKKAVWAVYAWGQRTDELVDKNLASAAVLDSWEKRLEDIFNGCPHDIADTALADTFQRIPLDIEPFKDLMQGMRMDSWKTRYENYEELVLYCYYVAITGCLMTLPIAGMSPESETCTESIFQAVVSLGIANQLTNILRDVAEDAERGRVYLPQDELREFGLTNEDIFSKNVTEEWREFIKQQIARARYYYEQGEHIASQLDISSRWPVWASMMLYRKILDKIEANNYDNLTKRAKVGSTEKMLTLPLAYAKAMDWYSGTKSVPR
ncbi:phytoene synthase 2, chloroplastic-like [Chenopodium quinoa]|uniref:phytoene synthase 2, chloroplastic-like n=1 Tax=Chenopodium quinoa TaxID=63459 RepID=UPI000B770F4C|nr:phytoene synthase 2, chloroplastic-like [Chenopodium quinoa]